MTDLIRPDEGIRVRGLRRVEFEQMVDQGLFVGEPIELLGGELVEVSPQGPTHRWVIARLTSMLAPLTRQGLEIAVQLPLAVDDVSLPESDLSVTDPSAPTGHPSTAHVVIEVAVSSQQLDLVHKAPRYAAANIPLYVVFDLPARVAVVHTGPGPEGYRHVERRGPGDALVVLDVPLDLAELLGALPA